MRRTLALVALLSLGGCASDPRTEATQAAAPATLLAAVDRAAVEHRVPREVLLGVAYAEGRWIDPGIPHEEMGQPGEAHSGLEIGPLHLRHGVGHDSLARALTLLGVDEAALRGSLWLQVSGAAAALAELGRETGANPAEVDSWAEAVARYSGLAGRQAQADYAEAVWEALRQGRRERAFTGEEIFLPGRDGPGATDLLGIEQAAQYSDDYPPARWVPASSSNYTASRDGSIRYVVIHDTEGSYAGAISWFQNPAASASAHYVIRSSDGQVTQMVRHSAAAWHAANRYINHNSIGIEHEGYYTAPERWFTEAMYVASARLTRFLCDRYRIPVDRAHIFGHYQVYRDGRTSICSGTWDYCRRQTGNHIDPGPGWNWNHYLDLVRGGGTTGPMYAATLVRVSYPRDMRAGERAVAFVEYRNTGSAAWDTTNTRLGTTQPRDHAGRLYDSINWLNTRRPTAVDARTAPSSVGRFSFIIRAPMVTTDTTVTESYGLVQEGTAWFGPPDNAVTFTVRVHPPTTTTPTDAGSDPDDASVEPDDADLSEDASANDGELFDDATVEEDGGSEDAAVESDASTPPRDAATVERDAGRRPEPMAGGCACSTTGRRAAGPAPWLAMLGLAALRRRSRRTPRGTKQ